MTTAQTVLPRWRGSNLLEMFTSKSTGDSRRGSFGVLDSERHDVTYENWHSHRLDRELLELLRAF